MSHIASHDGIVECNCVQYLDGNSVDFIDQNDNNNNNIIINATETTNNNTIIIDDNTNFDSNSHESKCEKAVQTIPEIETPKDFLVDKTTNMEKDRNDPRNFPFKSKVIKPSNFKIVQSNEDEVITIEELQASCSDINLRANNESNGIESTIGNDAVMPQNLSVSDERYGDKNVALNYSASQLDNSQIVQILNHSKWNKTVINSVMAKFSSSKSVCAKVSQPKTKEPVIDMSERSSNKAALKQILDIMDRDPPNVEMAENNVDVFTQTENARKDDKDTQTETGANSAETPINAELSHVALQEFLREGKIYFEEFQNKLQFLFLQYTIQSTIQKDKFRNNDEEKFFNEAENTFSSGSNEKVEKAVVHREGVIESNVVVRGPAGNSGSNINPRERQRQLDEEQTPAMQLPGPSAGNQPAAVRAGRPRSEQANARYSPYPRQQFWQSQNNGRQRPAPYVQEYHQMNGMHLQHNAMVRPFNGWQASNPANHQAYFGQQNHQQHHF